MTSFISDIPWRQQGSELLRLAAPIVGTALVQQLGNFLTMSFVGTRVEGSDHMGAVALGGMLCNISGYSLSYGMCTALDALISQAYGAREYLLMGLHTQRAMVILSLFAVPVAAIWAQTEWVLHAGLGIDAHVAALAGQWAWLLMIGLWPTLMYEVLKRFLQGQNVVWPSLVAATLRTLSVLVLSHTFLASGWGFRGLGLAQALSQWVSLISLSLLVYARRHPRGSLWLRAGSRAWASAVRAVAAQFGGGGGSLGSYAVLATSPSLVKDVPAGENVKSLGGGADDGEEEEKGRDPEAGSVSLEDRRVLTADEETSQWDEIGAGISKERGVLGTGNVPGVDGDGEGGDEAGEEFDAWPPWRAEAVLSGWAHFFRLGVPGAASLFIEWGSFELAASIAGHIRPSTALAVHGVFMNTSGLTYMIPVAVASATATLSGNLLGGGNTQASWAVMKMGIIFDFIYGVVAAFFLMSLRHQWGGLYTTDPNVGRLVARYMPSMAAYVVVDSMKCITLNILRSIGLPRVTVVVNSVACLAVLLPVGQTLGVRMHLGIPGLWAAMSIAWGVAAVACAVVIGRTDWEEQARVIALRNAEGSKSIEMQHM